MPIENIHAIVITYNPELNNVKKLITSLKQQNVSPLIVDNGTLNEEEVSYLSAIAHVITLKDNEGIAKAQNIGISFAKKNNADAVIFFDQDSQISSNFVESLVTDYL